MWMMVKFSPHEKNIYIEEFMHSLMKHDVRKAKILWTYSSFLGMDVEWNHEEIRFF
jgi:hypothetical protein